PAPRKSPLYSLLSLFYSMSICTCSPRTSSTVRPAERRRWIASSRLGASSTSTSVPPSGPRSLARNLGIGSAVLRRGDRRGRCGDADVLVQHAEHLVHGRLPGQRLCEPVLAQGRIARLARHAPDLLEPRAPRDRLEHHLVGRDQLEHAQTPRVPASAAACAPGALHELAHLAERLLERLALAGVGLVRLAAVRAHLAHEA